MRRLANPSHNRLGIKTVPWGLGRFGGGYFRKVLSTQPRNLIAYWPLWETQGIIARDLIDSPSQDGAYAGVTLGQPGIGDGRTSPLFDGINDFTNIYSASLNSVFNGSEGTMMLWIRVSGVGVWTDGIVRYGIRVAVDGGNLIQIYNFANNGIAWQYMAGLVQETVTKFPVSDTAWMLWAMTWSASADEMKAYFNGAQEGATQNTLGVWAGNLANNLTVVGASTTAPTDLWDGSIAHVALWNTALTPAQNADLAVI